MTGLDDGDSMTRAGRRLRLRLLLVLGVALLAATTWWSGWIEVPEEDAADDPCPADFAITLGADPSAEDWIRFLADPRLQGRRAGSDGAHEAGRALAAELRRLGLQAPASGMCPSFPLLGGRDFNVVVDLPTTGETDVRLLLGAHYDGQGLHPTRGPLPGADDNASGVAALLLAARRLLETPPEGVAVRLVFFAAEEIQGFGAQHFVQTLDDAERPDAALVLDMVGRPLPVESRVEGQADGFGVRTETPGLWRRLEDIGTAVGVPLVPASELGDAAPGFSDDLRLRPAGIPTALLSSGLHADYHAPGDLPELVGLHQVERAADLVEAWVRSYQRYTPQP